MNLVVQKAVWMYGHVQLSRLAAVGVFRMGR